MGFLRRVAGVSLRDKVKSAVIPEGLEVEPLFLCVERNQLTWFRCLLVAPLERCCWHLQLGGSPEQTQVQVERLYLRTSLGTPSDPPIRAS